MRLDMCNGLEAYWGLNTTLKYVSLNEWGLSKRYDRKSVVEFRTGRRRYKWGRRAIIDLGLCIDELCIEGA